jgi:hypothetical protein
MCQYEVPLLRLAGQCCWDLLLHSQRVTVFTQMATELRPCASACCTGCRLRVSWTLRVCVQLLVLVLSGFVVVGRVMRRRSGFKIYSD